MNEKNWSGTLLDAHFQSMNKAWSDRNSVMLLLAEIRDYLRDADVQDEKSAELISRIETFAATAATRVDRQPMKPAGKGGSTSSGHQQAS